MLKETEMINLIQYLRLCQFIIMMRKAEINASGMNVQIVANNIAEHLKKKDLKYDNNIKSTF